MLRVHGLPVFSRAIILMLMLLYVKEVVTLQKKIFKIFITENEVYTIY